MPFIIDTPIDKEVDVVVVGAGRLLILKTELQ